MIFEIKARDIVEILRDNSNWQWDSHEIDRVFYYAENSVINDEIYAEAVHDTQGPYEPAHNAILIFPR